MNREIKFKIWDKQNKIMLKNIYYMGDGLSSPIRNYNLLQFTGLKDKNGNEIYEGDIIHLSNSNFYYKVVFEYGSFVCYHINKKYGERWGLLSEFFSIKMTAYPIEVIGNIFQNPELLSN